MIPNWLLQRATLTPHRLALIHEGKQWTFRELDNRAHCYARKLAYRGLERGQRVALLSPSHAELVFLLHGCLYAGLEIVMLNTRLTASELAWQIEDANVQAVIVSDEYEQRVEGTISSVFTFSQLKQGKEQSIEVEKTWDEERTITIMYTSGTTGFPKGVRQTVRNHTSSAISSVLNIGLTEEDCWLCATPLFHISGFSILVRSVLYGMPVKLYKKFEVLPIVADIVDGKVTRMSVVSVMLHKIIQLLEEKQLQVPPTFKTMLVGGGPVPRNYLERAIKRGLAVLQTYGMTETSSQTATLSSHDALRKIGSSGKPLFFNEIKILGATAPKEVGEICIRGPHVTPGYIGRHRHQQVLIDGWFHSGDLGYQDEEGYLYVVDRRSDLIISGGENIYPAEIEGVLNSHPAVEEAGVCGWDDAQWGSVPIAFIVKRKEVSTEELKIYCEKRLAKYKVPKHFHFVEKLPRNAANKLVRQQLRQYII